MSNDFVKDLLVRACEAMTEALVWVDVSKVHPELERDASDKFDDARRLVRRALAASDREKNV